MGVVYLGREPGTGREVAIKTLLKGRGAAPQQRARFEREGRALAKVEHPNVVRLLDLGEASGTPYLVLAFHAQGSLADRMRTGVLSLEFALEVGIQVAAGLAAAHAMGVLHRDLNPANVLLGADGQALITDFGLAKDLEREGLTQELTKSGALQGTPGYMAPEQAAGQRSALGVATDVYGLGAVLYAALSGRAPIVGASLVEILIATHSESPPPLRSLRPEIPRGLESVVMRCLEKEPGARWESAAAVGEALAASLGVKPGAPVSKLALGLGLTAAGVACLAGAAWVLGGRRDGDVQAAGATSPRETILPTLGETPNRESPDGGARLYAQAVAEDEAGRLTEAAALYRAAAELGHSDAMFDLGRMSAGGRGIAPDAALAVEWYRRAAEVGHLKAMVNLGGHLLDGTGVAQDQGQAAEWFRRAAEAGLAEVMNNLGRTYLYGLGVAKDPGQAAEWFGRAARGGVPGGMVQFGVMLSDGVGIAQDRAQAYEWFRRAAGAGDSEGMYFLGTVLREGLGVGKDPAAGVAWTRRAAEQGYPEAMYSLSLALREGLGTEQDAVEAAKWQRSAADLGHPAAMGRMGTDLAGSSPSPGDVTGPEWLRRAAEAGHVGSMFNLGVALEGGMGVPKDLAEAARWYRRAAEAGLPNAMNALAAAFAFGRGVTRDDAEATRWFRRAAEGGVPDAMFSYGLALLRGAAGVRTDEPAAAKWFRRAAELGDANAMYSLGRMLALGRGLEQDEVQAVEWYRRGAERGQASAMAELGAMLATGRGVAQDNVQALEWLRRASQSTDPAAREVAETWLKRLGQ